MFIVRRSRLTETRDSHWLLLLEYSDRGRWQGGLPGGAMPNKYQREIEEILEASGEKPVPESEKHHSPRGGNLPKANLNRGRGFWRSASGKLFLVSVALLLAALLVSVAGGDFSHLLVWGALILFFVAYALFFIGRPGNTSEKRWRGRPIDDDDSKRLRR